MILLDWKDKEMTEVLAAIDMGTNAVRLLIAQAQSTHTFTTLFSQRVITRLGEGIALSGYLSSKSMERTLGALREYKRKVEEYGVSRIKIVATSVLRDAVNRQQFLDRVLQETGWQVEIISGLEEARNILRGVMAGFPDKSDSEILTVDIGGGSTEFIFAQGQEPKELLSVPLGVVYLTEQYLIHDPIEPEEYSYLLQKVRAELAWVKTKIPATANTSLVATAGTATTLAAINLGLTRYEPAKIHHHTISRKDISRVLNDLRRLTLAQRRTIPAIDRGREDLIIPGTVILLETMELFSIERMIVSEWGLREGLLLCLIDHSQKELTD
jgi:exopolyphosphatase/guanosine-5'-triphosphate,3'-diphosphate pyrophosphatase